MRLIAEIPDDLHRSVKVKVAAEGTTITSVVTGLLQGYTGYRPLPDARDDVVPDNAPVTVMNGPSTSNTAHAVTNAPKQTRQYLDLTKSAQVKGKMGR